MPLYTEGICVIKNLISVSLLSTEKKITKKARVEAVLGAMVKKGIV